MARMDYREIITIEPGKRSGYEIPAWRKAGNPKMTVLFTEQCSDLTIGRILSRHLGAGQTHCTALSRDKALDHASVGRLPTGASRRKDAQDHYETD